ncbi:MAG: NAD-glutamate dehydrogenase [Rhodoferax sp.]|uniref:NAD-glutamate dehydrogenase n=1 Tax=Rhodoferax sp. TaxID=50421 RepID=UPI00262C9069|nr:NAD-glutamate dehydrogenase [Rhodoferax sp.]MDD2879086.1 NAD-glutamate dehydrogenase [Rhodoferax sp.]
MTHAALSALRTYTLENAGSASHELADFVSAYFDSADPDELQNRKLSTLLALANAHWRLLTALPDATGSRIRVFNPTLAEDGFVSEHTVIQIVHDDMPFLVDSVTMAVNRSGRVAHWIVHPLLAIERNANGMVARASLATLDATHPDAISSLILVECDRILPSAEREQLAADLAQVLADVRAAVTDWGSMLNRLQAVREASSRSSTLSSIGHQEGVAFLSWLEAEHFTFLGARDYQLVREGDVVDLRAVPDSGLGILRGEAKTAAYRLPADALDFLESDQFVLVTKAMTRATVHRAAWLDCLTVKRFDESGVVTGEARFLGLYTSKAYASRVDDIPQIRRRAEAVRIAASVLPESHAAKSLQAILDAYPRDELFQVDTPTLIEHAVGILRLQERQRSRVFLRRDPFGRFTSVQVFVPRDRYNTELRIKIGDALSRALNGQSIEFTPTLTDSPLARIHYLVIAREQAPKNVDVAALEARIAQLARRWEDECQQTLLQIHGENLGLALGSRFADSFPAVYKEDFSGPVAAEDVKVLADLSSLTPMAVRLYRPLDSTPGLVRFKIFSMGKVTLSDSLPVLERMGARVLDEHPYQLTVQAQGGEACDYWIHDLGLQLPQTVEFSIIRERFEALFVLVWCKELDSDDLNKLVLVTRLDARAIAVLRAYTRYFKQLDFPYSQSYLEATLFKHAALTETLYQLFDARFNPVQGEDPAAMQSSLNGAIDQQLSAVASLDEDRILRQYHRTLLATLRTNVWQAAPSGAAKPYMSFKFKSHDVPGMPEPKPLFEIWVYSPRVEAIHLRIDKVARGGLRWSDRPEDFRTEILGLVKAQQVKNTVIVPVGSKGGFVLKNPPPAGDREAFMAEGIACYKLLLSGLLDLTDNLVKGEVVPPRQVVRHDADDPYLVVAADKGTASFSDIANSVSAEYGYWLGDAFASGGSVGYDHKKMGITARGAWESAKRHFRALSHDIQTTPFTVVGIGDMSGDVFGNGMVLSTQIKLVAAFDHRHIFIDPHPDVARSFAERQRLFHLPRSSWDDFDRSVMSEGAGIYPRAAKTISLSNAARDVLGIEAHDLSATDLLHALLQAPVDMIYNGGIGTYVKSSAQSNAQVGDKAGDAFRVNGQQLRCKVLVEGGNLGCTQLGRIEYAQAGGLIYTDAIDNSAGVDCSDHEVNIKILLDRVVEAGDLTLKQRNDLLASMTEEVGHLVLADNYYQTQALDVACHRPLYFLNGQQRLMQWLEGAGRLSRAVEFLPTDDEIMRRRALRQGLTAPEGAVVLAYAKMSVFDDLLASNLPDDPYFIRVLNAYFPKALTEKFASAIDQHPLKREIIATYVANTVVNRTGATFVNFLAAEAAASTADVVRAYTLAREIFDLTPLWDEIDALDGKVASTLQLDLLAKLIAIAQRASRWMLRARSKESDLPTLISRYQPGARELRAHLEAWLPASAVANWEQAAQALIQAGVATELARNLSALEFVFPALDLVDLTEQANTTMAQAAQTYFAVDTVLGLSAWRAQINRLPTDTLWQTQARGSAREDVYAIANQISQTVLLRFEGVEAWSGANAAVIARLCHLLQTISTQGADLAPVSVALRELRHLA